MPVLSAAEGPPSAEAAEVPRRIFSPIAGGYDRPALVLSLFQYRRWHRFLIDRVLESVRPEPVEGPNLPAKVEPAVRGVETGARISQDLRPALLPTPRVLDMATGTGALAFGLLSRTNATVVGGDITRPMLQEALRRADGHRSRAEALQLLQCTAEAPPFADETFDAITFAYLLRYVADVPATLHSLARLLRPGGVMASLDFALPRGVWYPLWRLYTDAVLPAGGLLFSRHWREVGSFLGPSVRGFYRRWPEERLFQAWRDAGFGDVRAERLSLGGGIVVWGRKDG